MSTFVRLFVRLALGWAFFLLLFLPFSFAFGQCTITIDRASVVGTGVPGSPPTSIQVSGTARECDSMDVIVICPPFLVPASSKRVVVTDESWTAELTIPVGSGCACDESVVVVARCKCYDPPCPDCMDREVIPNLPCQQVPCPAIQLQVVSIGDCNADGTRTVKLRATITAGSVEAEVRWNHDNGSTGSPCVIPASTRAQCPPNLRSTAEEELEEVNYLPGRHTSKVEILYPSGCKTVEVPIEVPKCAALVCPQIGDKIKYTLVGCVSDKAGPLTVRFTWNLSPTPRPADNCRIRWNFGDGVTEESDALLPFITHNYRISDPRRFSFSVAANVVCGPNDRSCGFPGVVLVEIPQVINIIPNVLTCADGVGNPGNVEFTPVTQHLTIPSPAPGTYTWDFGDGQTGTGATPTHPYSEPGEKTVIVTYAPDGAECWTSSATHSFNVTACQPTPPAPRSSCWPDWACWILLILALLFLLVGAILAFIAGCAIGSGNPVGQVLGGAVFILSLIFLAVAMGLLALFFWLCAGMPCDIWTWLVWILSVLAAGSLLLAIFLAIIGDPCALGALFSAGYIGAFLGWVVMFKCWIGCGCP